MNSYIPIFKDIIYDNELNYSEQLLYDIALTNSFTDYFEILTLQFKLKINYYGNVKKRVANAENLGYV